MSLAANMSEASLRSAATSPAALRTAGLRLDQHPQPTHPIERQDRCCPLLLRIARAQVRRLCGDRAPRSIRQRDRQPKLALEPPEPVRFERPVEQRVRHLNDPDRAGQNPAKMLQYVPFSEKLWKAAHALHPEGSPEAAAFVRQRAGRILNGAVSQVVKGLRQIVTKRRLTGTKAKTLSSVADYFYANRTRMAYNLYLSNGWPIASGAVEGTCKTLVRDRFERSGMRWCPHGAEAMLKTRAVYLSGDLDEYWALHVELDQQRLYPQPVRQLVAK